MVTGNPPMIGSGGDGFGGEDLGFLLREQKGRDRERELSIGSAPPTVEGSLTAMGGISGRQVASGISDLPARGESLVPARTRMKLKLCS
ncbi:hypothetical protein C4D60_Mb07t18700 [Musa balbisiana]|uniref:Uncharacterized protein n=1 Tax=Musa balbisiana TaxID=52838 RepID=A0A4S8JG98_MUSBA|nr:hypothetical protein C4D60_Mb07t18700 [Musa balbisiana]